MIDPLTDAPKYINYSRGDVEEDGETRSEAGDSSYSVAHFSRPGNYRKPSSASRSTYSKATEIGSNSQRRSSADSKTDMESTPGRSLKRQAPDESILLSHSPLDQIKISCAMTFSDSNSVGSSLRRPGSSHGTESEYSAATSLSSSNSDGPRRGGTLKGPSSHKYPPNSFPREEFPREDDQNTARKRGFFTHSPFRRKSKSEKRERELLSQKQHYQRPQANLEQKQHAQQRMPQVQGFNTNTQHSGRNAWNAEPPRGYTTSNQDPRSPTRQSNITAVGLPSSPEPLDPRTSFQLNVGENVFDVAPPDNRVPSDSQSNQRLQQEQKHSDEDNPELDPIAQALAELNNGGNVSNTGSMRKTADRFYGIATPAPHSPGQGDNALSQQKGAPPLTYTAPKRSALDAPAPAHTSAAMQQTLRKYRNDTEYMLEGPPQMPAALQDPPLRTGSQQSMRQRSNTVGYERPSSSRNSVEAPRVPSPNPHPSNRSVSPRPPSYRDGRYGGSVSPKPPMDGRIPSPNPYQQAHSRPGTAQTYQRSSSGIDYHQQPPPQYQHHTQQPHMRRTPSPNPMMVNNDLVRNVSQASYRPYTPNTQALVQQPQHQGRPRMQHSGSFSQIDAQSGAIESFGRRGRNSYYDSGYGGHSNQQTAVARPRSKSVVDTSRAGSFARDGRPILYYG